MQRPAKIVIQFLAGFSSSIKFTGLQVSAASIGLSAHPKMNSRKQALQALKGSNNCRSAESSVMTKLTVGKLAIESKEF